MSSPEVVPEKKTSRRRFITWAGTLASIGLVGFVLGDAADSLQGKTVEETSTRVVVQTPTVTTTTTQKQTVTDTTTGLLTETVTSTLSQTQTVSVAQAQTTSTSGAATTSQSPTVAAPFSIFWITDTQFLSESNPDLYSNLTNWIVNNWNKYNGKMVIHTGDIVQTGQVVSEWQSADSAMSVLLQNRIPYSWCAGNHDDLAGGDSTTGWIGNVSAPSFDPSNVGPQVDAIPYAEWVGDYHDGMNTAVSFTANKMNFLVINIEWAAQDDVLDWVGSLLDDLLYEDYYVIIAPHAYINAYGNVQTSSTGIDLTDFVSGLTALMDAHPSSVLLTLNGHYATDCGNNTLGPGNNRNELMFDRQDCTDNPSDPTGQGVDAATAETPDSAKVGGSTVTILTFDTANSQINVTTYDVNTGKWRANKGERFSVPMFPAASA